MAKVLIAPSILSADFSRLGEASAAAEAGGADLIHVDVMDGHFVPNITFGPAVVASLKRSTQLPLDVHLMISRPERYVADFVDAGADFLTVHAEATPHLHGVLTEVRQAGAKAGLAVNPLTPLDVVELALPYLDLVLVMSVNPGFGGQPFIPGSVARVEAARRMRDRVNPNCLVEVDGGITTKTAPGVVAAGADVLVAGSAVYGHGTVSENLAALRAALSQPNETGA
ncbi:MAG: ribulose-phosphate 3-epimerase [Trueperaceae bacterium]|nr:ribulose-phosphate 3-epimerase [Trueperaceae bacterium]MCC6311409.1 ribulose-phosphate 3-epimerase [Trueperaceae bacterium]MCO5174102.1 ribulose-phosphate 3-epimerase [Trueperaceae bacterium]MCW5820289.1 ribulose-phosphate 3-epimerase [Trueperaceae bacterium]